MDICKMCVGAYCTWFGLILSQYSAIRPLYGVYKNLAGTVQRKSQASAPIQASESIQKT